MATATPLSFDPVRAALDRPLVRQLTPERRVLLEQDLAAMAERAPFVAEALLQEGIEERIRAEEQIEELDDLTPEELAELERAADEAEEDLAAGRCVPLADVLAALHGA